MIGVMPEGFATTEGEDLWVPIAFSPERRAMHDEHYLSPLRAGRTLTADDRRDAPRVMVIG